MDGSRSRHTVQPLTESIGKLLRSCHGYDSFNSEVPVHVTSPEEKPLRQVELSRCCPIGTPHHEVKELPLNASHRPLPSYPDTICESVADFIETRNDVLRILPFNQGGAQEPSFASCSPSLFERASMALFHSDVLMECVDEKVTSLRSRASLDLLSLKTCERILLIDCETLGFGAAPIFLVGAAAWDRSSKTAILHQWFAHDYSEEPLVIERVCKLLNGCGLVTFNGKSFDIPMLRARCRRYGISWVEPKAHLDLLHISRRIWGRRLRDCRLSTLCAAIRHPVSTPHPSSLPQLYHQFVECPSEWLRDAMLLHNMTDLCALTVLLSVSLWCIAACRRCIR